MPKAVSPQAFVDPGWWYLFLPSTCRQLAPTKRICKGPDRRASWTNLRSAPWPCLPLARPSSDQQACIHAFRNEQLYLQSIHAERRQAWLLKTFAPGWFREHQRQEEFRNLWYWSWKWMWQQFRQESMQRSLLKLSKKQHEHWQGSSSHYSKAKCVSVESKHNPESQCGDIGILHHL